MGAATTKKPRPPRRRERRTSPPSPASAPPGVALSFAAPLSPRHRYTSLAMTIEEFVARGLFGTFRNTTAHAPKIKWVINEQDALDMLSLSSLLHRRLDLAVRTGRP
jgi:hypothetical protein